MTADGCRGDAPSRAPLGGRHILITRARGQDRELRRELEQAGGTVLSIPLIELVPPPDTAPLDEALARLDTFDWIVFTSSNAVAFFWERLHRCARSPERNAGEPSPGARSRVAMAALGPGTAAALRERDAQVDLIPARSTREGLLEALLQQPLRGRRILIPASDLADTYLDGFLEKRGARVTRVTAYCNRAPVPEPAALAALDATPVLDAVVFASPSAVEHVPVCLGEDRARRLHGAAAACLGPRTTAAARGQGYHVLTAPRSGSVRGLVATLCHHFDPSLRRHS